MSSEFIVGVVLGSFAAGLCLCLLTISIVIYICRNRLSPLHGVHRVFWSGSNKNSDCEKGYVESFEHLERYQDEKKSNSVVVEVLPMDTPLVDVEGTYNSNYVEKNDFLQESDVKVEQIAVEESLIYDGKNPYVTPDDRVAFVRALVAAKDEHAQQQFKDLVGGCQLEDFDFTPWLRNPSTPPIFTPSVPTAVCSKKSTNTVTRKTKRSWDTSDQVPLNFGSMQVKGIREIREDRPRQRDY
jgi:hypothetical protein